MILLDTTIDVSCLGYVTLHYVYCKVLTLHRFTYNTWASFLPHAHGYLLAGVAIEVVVDSVITVAVSYELLQGRSGMQQ
jgi:hypothetical protein